MDWAANESTAALRSGGDTILSIRRFTWGKPDSERDPYRRPPARTVAEVVERIKQIQDDVEANEPRGRHDGVASFNQVLHSVMTRLQEGVASGYFSDQRFVADFAVRLANRYFDVLRADRQDPDSVPAAWQTLLKRRDDPDIAAILFATGGLNALLNYDVPVALFEATHRRRFDRNLVARREDYQKVAGLFAAEVGEMREHFSTSLIRAIEPEAYHQVSGVLQNWSVQEAHESAWRNAQLLRRLRDYRVDKVSFLARLDGLVGLANGLLLSPTV